MDWVIIILLALFFVINTGGAGTKSNWYVSLNKPSFQPPGYVFGIVWTILYLIMAYLYYLLAKLPNGPQRDTLMSLFKVQLFVNITWTYLFFTLKQIFPSFIYILFLLVLNIGLLVLLPGDMKLLQVPYIIWLTIAAALAYKTFELN